MSNDDLLPCMELRKDPITRSWVITGDIPDSASTLAAAESGAEACAFCPTAAKPARLVASISAGVSPWSARSVVHPAALYQVEGETTRRGEGLYDRMRPVGAHELLLENAKHDRQLWDSSDAEVEQFLLLAAQRVQDLKLDTRLKYVSIFKNFGKTAGQEFQHPHAELTATTFVPRRVLYELRAAREYFAQKERCVFCDIINQELKQDQRVVEVLGDFVAMCPYAPRVPYETWIMPRTHESSFERFALNRSGTLRDLAGLLRHTLQRIRSITEDFHLVLHTSPNTLHRSPTLGYWKTIDEDYHWHIEIMPILQTKAKSYTFKEVYYSPVSSETATQRLREARVGASAA
jgi:UDPglucose--hexose-1-phosphate uridylyltransferase